MRQSFRKNRLVVIEPGRFVRQDASDRTQEHRASLPDGAM